MACGAPGKRSAWSLPDLERKAFIEIPGDDEGQHWVDGTGCFVGTFVESLFGIPPTGKTLYLRYTEMQRHADGRIVEYYLMLDFLGAIMQAGVYPLRPGLGHSGDDCLGLPASQRHLSLRVMDIWRREGSCLRGNRVAIDIPDMMMQMGLDVFSQMK